jgi:DNA-binding MarR family transcriptional regulator
MAVSAKKRASLERTKRGSALQLLFKCARLVNEMAMARVNEEAGTPVLKAAYTSLFPHLSFDGVRVSELARRLEVSKQAVSQTLAELAQLGMVELVDDPSDGRAKLARFTAAGADALAKGVGVLKAIEGELAEQIGERKMRGLHEALVALERVLDGAAVDAHAAAR